MKQRVPEPERKGIPASLPRGKEENQKSGRSSCQKTLKKCHRTGAGEYLKSQVLACVSKKGNLSKREDALHRGKEGKSKKNARRDTCEGECHFKRRGFLRLSSTTELPRAQGGAWEGIQKKKKKKKKGRPREESVKRGRGSCPGRNHGARSEFSRLRLISPLQNYIGSRNTRGKKEGKKEVKLHGGARRPPGVWSFKSREGTENFLSQAPWGRSREKKFLLREQL